MDAIYYLPAGFRLLIVKLDQQWIDMLELDQYVVQNSNSKQLAGEISLQLNKLSKSFPETLNSDNFSNLLYYSLFLAEEYEKLRKLISEPIDSFLDFSWYYITSFNVGDNIEKIDLPEFMGTPKNPLEEYMYSFMMYKKQDRAWEDQFYDETVEFLNSHQKLVLDNIVWLGIFLSTGFTIRMIKPNQGVEITNFLDTIFEEYNLRILQMYNYNQMGVAYAYSYEYTKAKSSFEKSIEIAEQINSHIRIGLMNNLSVVYQNTGNLEKAENLYLQSIEEDPDNHFLLRNLSDVYLETEKYEKALKYSKLALSKINDPFVDQYYPHHHSLLKLGRIDDARQILEKAESILESDPSTRNKANIIIMQARQNFYESNFGLAFKLYDQAKESEYSLGFLGGLFSYSIEKIEKQLEYIDIQVKLNSNAKSNLLYDVTSLIQLADEQGITLASVEALWLRGRIHHHFGNLEDARKDTYNAHKLADKFELDEISEQINSYREQLSEQEETSDTSIWNSIKSGVKKLLSIKVGGEIKKKDYQLHGVIVLSTGGIPLYDSYFTDKLRSDSTLVSGLIAAVSSFMAELIKGKGFLKGISHDDMNLLLEPVKRFVIVSIASTETYDLRLKTKNYSHEIENILDRHDIEDHPGEVTKELEEDLNTVTTQMFTP